MTSVDVTDRAAAAAEFWDRIVSLARGLDEGDWRRPTPCDGWSVKDLLGHCSGFQVGFDAGLQVPPPDGFVSPDGASPLDARTATGVAARHDWSAERVLGELDAARAGHVARLEAVADWSAQTEGPLGMTTEDGLYRTRLFDLWVHLQDLHLALGQPLDYDDGSEAARVAHGYVIERAGWLLVKKAGAGDGAALRLQLGPPLGVEAVIEVAGGRGRLIDAAPPGVDAVTGSPAGFTLLTSGRVDPEHLRAEGRLDWTGPIGKDFVTRARLFS